MFGLVFYRAVATYRSFPATVRSYATLFQVIIQDSVVYFVMYASICPASFTCANVGFTKSLSNVPADSVHMGVCAGRSI